MWWHGLWDPRSQQEMSHDMSGFSQAIYKMTCSQGAVIIISTKVSSIYGNECSNK